MHIVINDEIVTQVTTQATIITPVMKPTNPLPEHTHVHGHTETMI